MDSSVLIQPKTEIGSLGDASKSLQEFNTRVEQNDQHELDLERALKRGGAGASHLYQPEKFSKFRVPNVGDTSLWMPAVQAVDSIPLPRALRTLQPECQINMGLFSEIHRAWIVVDNRLFLWNYYKGEDFYVFDGLDQLIVAVGIARPRPGIFLPTVQFVLAVSTPVEVFLLAVKFDGDPVYGDICLEPTEFSITTDNVPMRCITGTADGRIFMGGHDGILYEFFYEPSSFIHSLGLKRQCRKLERSGGISAKWLLPNFVRNLVGGSFHSISRLCVDHERNLLYTLGEDSSNYSHLAVYSLGKPPDQHSRRDDTVTLVAGPYPVKTLFDKFLVEQRISVKQAGMIKGDYGSIGAKGIRLISLDIVRKSESSGIHLVGVSDRGVRIYFTTGAYNRSGARLSVCHVRGPPNADELRSFNQRAKNNSIDLGFNYSSTSLLAKSSQRGLNSNTQISLTHGRFGDENAFPEEGILPGSGTDSLVDAATCSAGVTFLAFASGNSLKNNLSSSSSGRAINSTGEFHNNDTLCAYSTDLSMRRMDSANEFFKAAPAFRWNLEPFHEVIDQGVIGESSNHSYTDQSPRESLLPSGRVWDIIEKRFDPIPNEDLEGIYSHMLCSPPTSNRPVLVDEKWIPPSRRTTSDENKSTIGNKRSASSLFDETRLSGKRNSSNTDLSASCDAVPLTDLARQHVLPRRYFFVLTSSSLWILVKNQPINQLFTLFRGPDPGSNADLEEFFKQYGLDESCAMTLAIAAKAGFPEDEHLGQFQTTAAQNGQKFNEKNGEPSGPFTASGAIDSDTQNLWVARRAALWFRRIGYGIMNLSSNEDLNQAKQQRLPCYKNNLGVNSASQQVPNPKSLNPKSVIIPNSIIEPGSIVNSGEIEYSGCYTGLCLHLSRLLKPFWSWPVVVGAAEVFTQSNDIPVMRCQWSCEQLQLLWLPLLRLKRFMETQAPFSESIREYGSLSRRVDSGFSGGSFGGGGPNAGFPNAPSALYMENMQIYQMFCLLDRSIQSLVLFQVLQSSPSIRFAKLVSLIDVESRVALSKMSWCDLVVTDDGKVVVCDLVKVLVEKSIQSAGNELIERLEHQCPAFFRPGDALVISAFDELSMAEKATTDKERNSRLKLATEKLREGFEKVSSSGSVSSERSANVRVMRNSLRDACDKLERLGNAEEAIAMALFCATCYATSPLDVLPIPLEAGEKLEQIERPEFLKDSSIKHQAVNEPDATFLEMRKFCYGVAVAVISRHVPGTDEASSALSEGRDQKKTASLEALLRQALGSYDALWHFSLYRYLLERGLKHLVLTVDSPFIVQFLADPMANDPRKAGVNVYQGPVHKDMHLILLAEWYGGHNKNVKAALAMQRLAKLDAQRRFTNKAMEQEAVSDLKLQSYSDIQTNPNLNQRIQYLTKALNYAKASNGHFFDQENYEEAPQELDITRLKDELDIALLQKDLIGALTDDTKRHEVLLARLRNSTEYSQHSEAVLELSEDLQARHRALESLSCQLFSPSDIYNGFAYRFSLWESCLMIMRECEYEDMDEIQTLYRNIFRRATVDMQGADFKQLISVLGSLVLELGQKFYNSNDSRSFVFPYEYLVHGLEDLSAFYLTGAEFSEKANGIYSDEYRLLWNPWVMEVMLQVGLSFERLIEAYSSYNTKIQNGSQPLNLTFLGNSIDSDVEWYSERSKFRVASAIVELIRRWRKVEGDKHTGLFHDAKVGDLLERQRVIVGSLHSSEVTEDHRKRLQMALDELLSTIHG